MTTVKITIINDYVHGVVDEFTCRDLDITDVDEVNYCVEECIGVFIDNHHDVFNTLDADWDDIMDSFHYIIEEAVYVESY